LKEIVNGSVSLETILMRLKVILSDLENDTIMSWVRGELEGYSDRPLPSYRIFDGQVRKRSDFFNLNLATIGRSMIFG